MSRRAAINEWDLSANLDADTLYMRDVSRYSRLLSPEEERELAIRARAGDREAMEKLLLHNLRFVIRIAKKYKGRGLDRGQLISAGNLGLMKAIRKFDPDRGVRLVNYAAFWIVQQIQKELDGVGDVRPTQTQQMRNRSIRRRLSEAAREGRTLSVDDLVRDTGFSRARVQEALNTHISFVSLDAPLDANDESSTSYAQVISNREQMEEAEEAAEMLDTINKAIRDVLDAREAKIIRLYFGIGGHEPWPLNHIGRALGISRERARQLKERAIEKLRDSNYAGLLREFLGLATSSKKNTVIHIAPAGPPSAQAPARPIRPFITQIELSFERVRRPVSTIIMQPELAFA